MKRKRKTISNNSVVLQGTFGGDETHALSAWTSTNRELTDDKRNRLPKLLSGLATDGHHSPFEKSYLQFLVRVDTASHIHLIKHRIAVAVNGESARYKELKEPSCYIPPDWPGGWQNILKLHMEQSEHYYHTVIGELTPTLGRKRAKESARFFLPYANQLTLDVSFNFRSFMHFCKLRYDDHAQKEIYWVAEEMLRLVRETGNFKHSLEAFGYGDEK